MISVCRAETEEKSKVNGNEMKSQRRGLPVDDGGGGSRPQVAQFGGQVAAMAVGLSDRKKISKQGRLATGFRTALGREGTPVTKERRRREGGKRRRRRRRGRRARVISEGGGTGVLSPHFNGSPLRELRRRRNQRPCVRPRGGRGTTAVQPRDARGVSAPEEEGGDRRRDPLLRPFQKRRWAEVG